MSLPSNLMLAGFNPDPSIVRVGSDYFVATSTFEFFPGIPIYHSKDLVTWTLIGHALTRTSQLNVRTVEPGSGVWAPTIRYHNGTFYIITCCFTAYCPQQDLRVWPRGFYVSTTNIWTSESWSDPLYFDQPGFDQDLFWDDDGRVYLSTCYRAADHNPQSGLKGFAVHTSEIDLATGRSLCAPVVIRKSPSGVAEGSHIIKKDKFYYLFTAEGGTESGHSEYVFRSETGPFGPWESGPSNPLLSASVNDDVQNTGHADLVEDGHGEWWAVCLAVRPHRIQATAEGNKFLPSPFGRESFIMKVKWKDGWPVLNEGQKLRSDNRAQERTRLDWREDFESDEMALGWYHKNTPLRRDWSLEERPGWLRLRGGPYNLRSLESPTMLLRKQTRDTGIWITELDFQPSKETYEAGAVVYWNIYTFASIGIRKSPSGTGTARALHIAYPSSEKPGEFQHSTFNLHKDGVVNLCIYCSRTHYKLGYNIDPSDSEVFWLVEVPMQDMTADPPRGMAFTGMMLGLYTFGELEPCIDPADFLFAAWKDHPDMPDTTTKSANWKRKRAKG